MLIHESLVTNTIHTYLEPSEKQGSTLHLPLLYSRITPHPLGSELKWDTAVYGLILLSVKKNGWSSEQFI